MGAPRYEPCPSPRPGSGNVAQGALEVLAALPTRLVDPFELEGIVARASGEEHRTHTVYVAVAKDQHMVRRRTPSELARGASGPPLGAAGSSGDLQGLDSPPLLSPGGARELAAFGAPFDSAHYRAHPEAYAPHFHATVLPFASVIVNCMYWVRRGGWQRRC